MYKKLGDGFRFVETEPMEEFRSKMGWGKEDIPPYVLKCHLSADNDRLALRLSEEADVVIMGTAPEKYVKNRLDADKLTFRLSERPLKEGRWKIFVPYLAKKFYINHISRRGNRYLYCLCAGAYVASDFEFLLGSYRDKCYKFGYFPFPESKTYEELSALKMQSDRVRILWCGRFLKLKRADLLVRAASAMKDKGYDFELEFVGDGEEEKHIREMVKECGMEDRTAFMGYMSPEDTRAEMEKADIYVCTSNKLEAAVKLLPGHLSGLQGVQSLFLLPGAGAAFPGGFPVGRQCSMRLCAEHGPHLGCLCRRRFDISECYRGHHSFPVL